MDVDSPTDIDEALKLLPKNIHFLNMRIEEGKKTISELAKKENYIIKILIEAELQEKRENEASLVASEESLKCLLQNLNKRKTFSEMVMKNINEKRNKLHIKLDQDASQNFVEEKKHVMEKIKEQTEIVKNLSVILKRTNAYIESIKCFHSKNNKLELDIAKKKNELDDVLDIYSSLNQVYQNIHKNNIKVDLELKELDKKTLSLQSNIDLLSHDTQKLSSD